MGIYTLANRISHHMVVIDDDFEEDLLNPKIEIDIVCAIKEISKGIIEAALNGNHLFVVDLRKYYKKNNRRCRMIIRYFEKVGFSKKTIIDTNDVWVVAFIWHTYEDDKINIGEFKERKRKKHEMKILKQKVK